MINSMTGYGNADGRLDGVTYIVEIGTVNNRYFKAMIRLPETLEFLETDIEKVLRHELSRGTANYTLRQKDAPAEAIFEINEKALKSLISRLSKISPAGDVERELDLGGLLALPGILSPAIPTGVMARRIRKKVITITQLAIKALKAMRATEGAALAADLRQNCKSIKTSLERIRRQSITGPSQYAEKLKKRVDEMLAAANLKLDDDTIAREVAVFADRADISEEIARLDSHLAQFNSALSGKQQAGSTSSPQAGRKLDFICQEMLREANTIGSKAADADIVYQVVEIKCRIDRIKEQVQNVE
jgi:uncharacterized protein (TIGR00255 family)